MNHTHYASANKLSSKIDIRSEEKLWGTSPGSPVFEFEAVTASGHKVAVINL